MTAALRRSTTDCAQNLLLALWPGLDAICSGSLWRSLGAADVLARTNEAVRCLDLGRVNSIAGLVLRSRARHDSHG